MSYKIDRSCLLVYFHLFVKVREDCKCRNQIQPSKVKQFLNTTAPLDHWILINKINFYKYNIQHEHMLQERFGSSAVKKKKTNEELSHC